MTDILLDRRDMNFVLFEMLEVDDLTRFEYFGDHSRETFEMALDSAYDMAREIYWPAYQAFDEEGVKFDGEHTHAPSGMKAIWEAFQQSGWFTATSSHDNGGQQFPWSVFGKSVV